MSDRNLCLFSLIIVQIINLAIYSVCDAEKNNTEKAFYLTQKSCDKITNEVTGAPILLTAAHVVVAGRVEKIEKRYGPTKQLYSVRVKPQCFAKGDSKETEIVVRNLGKTKCGPSEAEMSKVYLFFLRSTADPKVFEALNLGVKPISGPMMWSPIFTSFCGITKKVVCEASKCPMACGSYKPPSPNACITTQATVNDNYKLVAPTTTTIAAPTTKPTTAAGPTMTKKPMVKDDGAKNVTVTYAPNSGNTPVIGGVKGTGGNGQGALTYNVVLLLTTVLTSSMLIIQFF